MAICLRDRPEPIKKKTEQKELPVSGLFYISKVTPMPLPRPVGLVYALRIKYEESV